MEESEVTVQVDGEVLRFVKDEMIDYMIEAQSKPIQPYRYAHYVAHYSGYKN